MLINLTKRQTDGGPSLDAGLHQNVGQFIPSWNGPSIDEPDTTLDKCM